MWTPSASYATILIISYLILISFAEVLYHKFKWPAEYSRKMVHIASGLISLSLPFLFDSHWYVLLLALLMISLMLVAQKTGFLKSIHKIERASWGDLFYPISFYLCFVVAKNQDNNLYFILPLLVLIFSDSLAALVGKVYKWYPYSIGKCQKSIGGSMAFLLSALFLSILSFAFFEPSKSVISLFIHSSFIAIGGSIIEAISPMGSDNLTVPVFILILLFIL